MAELIGAIGSIAGLAMIAVQSVKYLTETIDGIQDAPHEIIALKRELRALKPILSDLVLRPPIAHTHYALALQDLSAACSALSQPLRKLTNNCDTGLPSLGDKWRLHRFCSSKIPRLRATLDRSKATLTLALVAASRIPDPTKMPHDKKSSPVQEKSSREKKDKKQMTSDPAPAARMLVLQSLPRPTRDGEHSIPIFPEPTGSVSQDPQSDIVKVGNNEALDGSVALGGVHGLEREASAPVRKVQADSNKASKGSFAHVGYGGQLYVSASTKKDGSHRSKVKIGRQASMEQASSDSSDAE